MSSRFFARFALAAGLVALALFMRPGAADKAEAQGVSISVEFREALAPHGRWQRHSRWGEVWVPARVDREWRPYTRGRWVYTEEWGWYWVSGNEEADWGWVAYHYGRWAFDREAGWVWVPGNEWAPAWVSWRRGGGGEEVGWAALPPDDYVDEIDDNPDVWVFVRTRDVIAPSLVTVILPRPRAVVLVRETVVVNRTVFVSGARVAANVGVPPSYVAVRTGRPFRVSRVQPVVVRGTVGVTGAVQVDPRDRRGKQVRRATVQQAERSIQPAKEVPAPRRFERGNVPDSPDAPSVFRQAQPDQQQKKDDASPKSDTQKQDEPKAKQERQDDAAPKTKQEKRDEAPKQKRDDAPNAKDKRDDAPKAKQEKREDAPKAKQDRRDDDAAPKQQPKRDDNGTMRQKRDDDAAPKQQPKRDDNGTMRQKRDDDAAPKQQPKRDDAPRGDQQPKRDMQPKQDAAPKGPPPQAPQRPDGPPARDKKDN
jgi:hypothetical protein